MSGNASVVWTLFVCMAFCLPSNELLAEDQSAGETAKTTSPKGSLVVCGGGKLPDVVMRRFVELAGGDRGRLVVIPTAGSDDGMPAEKEVEERWKERGIGSVSVLHTRSNAEADALQFVEPLNNATAVWISGGQQSRLAKSYVGTETERALVELFHRGGVVGGSSAGAAIQSRVMIQSGNPEPKVTTGFDLLPSAIVDQHFLRRNRFNRLITAVTDHPDCTGVGIDESTAVVFRQGICSVLGDSYVTVVAMGETPKLISVNTFRSGQQFRLVELD